jgi:hypothetical protein
MKMSQAQTPAPASSGVNLKKSFAKVQESLAALADGLGVKRSFTVPFVDGQPTAEHVASVGQAAQQNGGLTKNLITSGHRSDGRGWGSGDGETAGHPVQKLKETLIPKEWDDATAAISAAQRYISAIGSLLGKTDQSVVTAQSQLNLVKPTNAAGMTLFDFCVLIQQVLFTPTQSVARSHSGTKAGGHAPNLRAPAPGTAPTEDDAQPGTAPAAPAAPVQQ